MENGILMEPPATNPDTNYVEEVTTPLAKTTLYDEAILNLNRSIASDTAVLKTRVEPYI